MKLHPGQETEYERRHRAIWPALADLLRAYGISQYSIHQDRESGLLLGCLTIGDERRLDELASEPLMKTWWTYMKDIMETHEDHSPVTTRLREVFFLP